MTIKNKIDERPKWISFKNFLLLLRCKNTQDNLAIKLKDYVPDIIGYEKKQIDCEELSKKHFPFLLQELRMFDITDSYYWGASFLGVFVFLIIETLVFFLYDFTFARTIAIISISLMLVIVSLFAPFIFFLKEKTINYSIPVMIISSGLIILNFVLIAKTGWKQSPFLPAFFFTNITIVTAPRENSITIFILAFLAIIITMIPFLIGFMNPVNFIIVDYGNLTNVINILTLIFTVGLVIISRHYSSKKIMN